MTTEANTLTEAERQRLLTEIAALKMAVHEQKKEAIAATLLAVREVLLEPLPLSAARQMTRETIDALLERAKARLA